MEKNITSGKVNQDFDFKKLRHYLHQNPEISGQEIETANYVIKIFEENFNPDQTIRIGGHGIAFVYDGQEAGKTVLIRCELDALPIQEINNFSYKSKVKGVSHKCGHDGHMSILCAVGQHLHQTRIARGRVVLLFQPAEETGEGARTVFEDPKFNDIKPDYAFSLHNLPGNEMHKILCKAGSFNRAVKSMIIKLQGKTAHASQPETGVNPGLAIAQIIQSAEKINEQAVEGSLITLIHAILGEKAYGVSAGYGEVHFTLRGFDNGDLDLVWQSLEKQSTDIARSNNLIINFDWTEEFVANVNSENAVEMIRIAAEEESLDYLEMDKSNPWGEDFGIITSNMNGAMFGLGAGLDTPDLHNPDYDFPDVLIETGKAMFVNLINQALKS